MIMIVVVLEVEERKQFLDEMTVLGRRREYQQVISNEIADVSMLENRKLERNGFIRLITFCFRKYGKWSKLIDNVQKPWKNV